MLINIIELGSKSGVAKMPVNGKRVKGKRSEGQGQEGRASFKIIIRHSNDSFKIRSLVISI